MTDLHCQARELRNVAKQLAWTISSADANAGRLAAIVLERAQKLLEEINRTVPEVRTGPPEYRSEWE